MTSPETPDSPFITPDDVMMAQSRSPRAIGQVKLTELSFHIDMTPDEIRAVAEQAIAIKEEYEKWEQFYRDLKLRKLRLQGFQAVVLALDVSQAAAAMGTTPEKVNAVMSQYAAAEKERVDELQEMWRKGKRPEGRVLSDPSEQVIDPDLTDDVEP